MKNPPPLFFRETLRIARDMRASDVHLSAGLPVALRIDGNLERASSTPVTSEDIGDIVTHCFVESALRRLDADGDATVTYCDDEAHVTRVHALKGGADYALALRLLALEVPSLESLRLPASAAQLIERNHGLIIVSGPTGSGKSTALAAMVDRLNRTRPKHIITIEDPIEYRHKPVKCRITQREVGRDTPSFFAALLGSLRSDPDVLLVGEMRDRETMQATLTAAETGHLVLCTMHTGSASESVDRIIGSFDGAAQIEVRGRLAESLAGVMSLRLLPRAKGSGRLAAVETLVASDAVRVAIRDAKTHHLRNIIATGRSCGMQTLEAHLSELLQRGDVSYATARLAADRPDELRAPELSA
ncbi:MAG TPA: PilT/PilU family type 4a pilus ATPase [Candidatus Rubrimentiphilum sp.]|nr:PilT/PilU family type 4a pilus ATPase [Candidatus Rubrimentiphilum sp.]